VYAMQIIWSSGLHAGARALSFPLIVFAQQGLVLLALSADFRERRFYAGNHSRSFRSGVQRACGKREIDSECIAFLARVLRDISVQLHQVRRIPLEQLFQLRRLTLRFFFDGLAPFFTSVANSQFHGRTFPGGIRKGDAIRGSIRKRMGNFRIAIRQRGCKLQVRVAQLNRPNNE